MTGKPRAWIISFGFTILGLMVLTRIPGNAGLPLIGTAFYAFSAMSGFAHGFLMGRESALAVGWGTFAAAALFSVPVVLVTYGFALAGAPLVIAFAVLSGVAAHLGGRVRESRGAP